MHFIYGLLSGAAAVVIAQGIFDYSLTDLILDALQRAWLFIKRTPNAARTLAVHQLQRASDRTQKVTAKLKELL